MQNASSAMTNRNSHPALLRAWYSRRFITVGILLVIIAISIAGMMAINTSRANIAYKEKGYPSTPAAVCPGEKFTYPVQVSIPSGNTVSRISENWCRKSDGICPDAYDTEKKPKGSIIEKTIEVTATRYVPDNIPPGDWQMVHCNTNITDSGKSTTPAVTSVSCYAINVKVKPPEQCSVDSGVTPTP